MPDISPSFFVVLRGERQSEVPAGNVAVISYGHFPQNTRFNSLSGLILGNGHMGPHPGLAYGRGIGLEDAADDSAVGERIEVVVIPLAGRARGGRAFEDEPCQALFSLLAKRDRRSSVNNDAGRRTRQRLISLSSAVACQASQVDRPQVVMAGVATCEGPPIGNLRDEST